MSFLDETGLSRLWEKIKAYVSDNAGVATEAQKLKTARAIDGVLFDGSAARHHYGTCSTSGATAAKTCSITGFSLVTGARVVVRFSYANTAANPTLNVSSTGAKAIYYKGAAIPASFIRQYTVLELVYSGAYWYVVGDLTGYLMDLFTSPTVLYSSATGIYASALNTWKYTTVSGLSSWKEVRMYIEIGDGERGYRTFTRNWPNVWISGYVNGNFNGCAQVHCDFINNRVGIYVKSITGWVFTTLRVVYVEGLVKN